MPALRPVAVGARLAVTAIFAGLALAGAAAAAKAPDAPPPPEGWRRNLSIASGGFISNRITALAGDGTSLWAGTAEGLAWTETNGRYWGAVDLAAADALWSNRKRPLTPAERRNRRHVTVAVARAGTTWVGTLDGLLATAGGRWFVIGAEKGLPEAAVWDLALGRRRAWLVGAAGVFHSEDSGASWHRVRAIRPWGERARRGRPPFARVALSDTAVWLSRRVLTRLPGRGFALMRGQPDGSRWERIYFGAGVEKDRPRLVVHRLRAFGADLWVGTSSGIFVLEADGHTWRHVSVSRQANPTGLPDPDVLDILKVENRFWVATADGIAYSDDAGATWRADAYPRGRMTALAADRRALWVGSEGGLLRRLSGGRFWQSFSNRRRVRAVAVVPAGKHSEWWVGTQGGLCLSTDQGRTWRVFTVADRLPSNVINDIAADGAALWVATDGGVAMRRQYTDFWRRYGLREGLLDSRVTSIAAAGGVVWAATGRGLSRLDRSTTTFRTFMQLRSWEHVAFDGVRLLAATRDWRPDDLAAEMRRLPAPPTGPFYRFVRRFENGVGWEDLDLDGYTGGGVHDVRIGPTCYWVLTDSGLFASRHAGRRHRGGDDGTNWARYGAESLWGDAATCMTRFPDGGWMVQSVMKNPGGPLGFWSVTPAEGREWLTVRARLESPAVAAAADGRRVICGGPSGLYVLDDATSFRLVEGRPGQQAFRRMAWLSSTCTGGRFAGRSRLDRYGFHGPSLWTVAPGLGAVHESPPEAKMVYRPAGGGRSVGGPLSINLFDVRPAPEGVWLVGEGGATLFDRISTWRAVRPSPEGLRGGTVRAVVSSGGVVWFGTEAGCSALDLAGGTWRRFDATNSPLPPSGVTCLEVQGGRLWAGTAAGLFGYTAGDGWRRVLPAAKVLCLAAAPKALCAGTDRGLYLLAPDGRILQHLDSTNSRLRTNRVERLVLDGADLWAGAGGNFVRMDLALGLGGRRYAVSPSLRGPEGVLVVYNEAEPASKRVAEHYARARGIPRRNLCAVRTATGEDVSREVFERTIRNPVAAYLLRNGLSRRISCIVPVYGVPLRIFGRAPAAERSPWGTDRASVDSELTLIGRPHPLAGPLANRYLHRDETFDSTRFGMYLVTRLDGPTPEAAMALVDRALATERRRSFARSGYGLLETAAVSADHPEVADAIKSNYHDLDRQGLVEGRVTLVEELAQPEGDAHRAYLYMGARPKGAERLRVAWVEGAVAVMMGAGSARSVRDPKRAWCAEAIARGVTGVIGNGFGAATPAMSEVGTLVADLQRGHTWAEAAYMALPYLSWEQVVIGDPLYQPLPFK